MRWLKWLLWLQERNRQFNGHFPVSHHDYYIDGAEDEIREIRECIAEWDHDELELEVGDLLWDVLSLINKLDYEKKIDINRVCPRAVAKFAERMPYNVEGFLETVHHQNFWDDAKKLQKVRWIDESHPLVLKVWDSIREEEIIKKK